MANILKKILTVWLMLALGCAPVSTALAAAATPPVQDCAMHDGNMAANTAAADAAHGMHAQHVHPADNPALTASACPHCGDADCGPNGCSQDDCCAFHAQHSVLAAPWAQAYTRADAAVAAEAAPSHSRHDPPLPKPPS